MMTTGAERARKNLSKLSVHWRGHFLLFDREAGPGPATSAGARLLFIAVVLEAVRIGEVRWLHPLIPLPLLIPLHLALTLVSVRFIGGLRLSQIGFHPWSRWSPIEKSYFLQLLLIANLVFPMVFAARLRMIFAQSSVWGAVWSGFTPYLFFGFYQEVIYRGLLQSDLVRRWGTVMGVLASNALYAFGPLHAYYFSSPSSLAIPMFASIFAIGLFFGALFRRSGNLWIVAIIHGIGNAYIAGSLGPVR